VLLRDGKPVGLKPKALDTLIALIEHRDRVVEKGELMDLLWPDTAVEEANLTQNIFVLRKALGDAPGEQRFIATVARRGYRFVADVRVAQEGADPAAEMSPRVTATHRRRLWGFAAGALLLAGGIAALVAFTSWSTAPAVGPIKSIAVLPFRNLSGSTEQQYFADGMTEAVITDLAAVTSLRVVSRQSVERYRDSRKPMPEIGRELGADAVVQGSVARSGGRIRINVQLVHAASDAHLWTATYDRAEGNVLSLQGELARAVADTVYAEVRNEEGASLAERRQVDPEAYDLYLRGRYFWQLRTRDALQKSVEYYQRAIARDPTFAPAFAGLALTFEPMAALGYVPPQEAAARVRAAVDKALALDPGSIDARVAHAAWLVLFEWDWDAGEREWKRILQRQPNHPTARVWYGFLLERIGRLEEALAERERAVREEPLSLANNSMLAETLSAMGRHREATDRFRRTLELDREFFFARWGLGWEYMETGQTALGLAELEAVAADNPDDVRILGGLGHAYARAGRRDDALKILESLQERATREYVPPHYLAHVYAGLGDNDAAFSALEQSFAERNPNMVSIAIDPRLAPLRNDPRFERLIRRMNLPWSSRSS
jgi:TolB-like protein/DNA-binding winged helix-turn-helix (wHTH) protein/Tfp pilus assembly protein PilF